MSFSVVLEAGYDFSFLHVQCLIFLIINGLMYWLFSIFNGTGDNVTFSVEICSLKLIIFIWISLGIDICFYLFV
jgi:hypothetical protein